MRRFFTGTLVFLIAIATRSQNPATISKTFTDSLIGKYYSSISPNIQFSIETNASKLYLNFAGQGKAELKHQGGNRFLAYGARPEAFVEFFKDSAGNFDRLEWLQDIGILKWKRVEEQPLLLPHASSKPYQGRYEIKNAVLLLTDDGETLTGQVLGESKVKYQKLDENKFGVQLGQFKINFEFTDLKDGKYQQIMQTRSGGVEFRKIKNISTYSKTLANRTQGFTREDSLQGTLSPLRTCFDVVHYDLDARFNFDNRSLTGSNKIRFRAVSDFDKMQIDLFANMKIEKILYKQQPVKFDREYNAVYISFPNTIRSGAIDEIEVVYSGIPQAGDFSTLSGGFIWAYDRNGNRWIESVCQGVGASLWWPCKDHLSDEPDSMSIKITIPKEYDEISNGALIKKTPVEDSLMKYEWRVSYPINIYNVVVVIGKYVMEEKNFQSEAGSIPVKYYYLPYNKEPAKKLYDDFPRMLALHEKFFGPYPFKNDGITIMESPYPMEHQGAVSMGAINSPFYSGNIDGSLRAVMWHEIAHEWWGNNVSCSDNADLWIHEGFASYAEFLNYEVLDGKEKALKKLNDDKPQNKEAMIGIYGVNEFKLGDIYPKGARLVHTLRSIIDNDEKFISLLRSIQKQLGYKSINSEILVDFICSELKLDLKAMFNQYLRHPKIPELEMRLEKVNNKNVLKYRWNTDEKNFRMPVKISSEKDKWVMIYPENEWKELPLTKIPKVDTENFYVNLNIK